VDSEVTAARVVLVVPGVMAVHLDLQVAAAALAQAGFPAAEKVVPGVLGFLDLLAPLVMGLLEVPNKHSMAALTIKKVAYIQKDLGEIP
jgi:hypothetical protein